MKIKLRALLLALGMMVGVGAAVGGPAPSVSAAGQSVEIWLNENPCYVWGQKLSSMKVVINPSAGYGGESKTLTVYGSRVARTTLTGNKSYAIQIQTWCSGPFLGRTASGNRWVYSTGTSYLNFWAGIHTGNL